MTTAINLFPTLLLLGFAAAGVYKLMWWRVNRRDPRVADD